MYSPPFGAEDDLRFEQRALASLQRYSKSICKKFAELTAPKQNKRSTTPIVSCQTIKIEVL
jgi:hypothetical protein